MEEKAVFFLVCAQYCHPLEKSIPCGILNPVLGNCIQSNCIAENKFLLNERW